MSLAEQEAIIEGVTGNGSHQQASAVNRNGCERCEKGWLAEREWHCRTCHSDRHAACDWCHACLPDRHRRDRRYCSATCRVRALEWRRSPEGQQARQREQARVEQLVAVLGELDGTPLGTTGEQRQAARRVKLALATGETCAICGRDPGNVVYWRPVWTSSTSLDNVDQVRAASVCAGCFCDHRDWSGIIRGHQRRPWLCERCQPQWRGEWTWDPLYGSEYKRGWSCAEAGANHRNLYCEQCHPRRWQAVPCGGCERTIMIQPHGNRSLQPLSAYDPDARHEPAPRPVAYCSQRCRSRVDHQRAATRRLQARHEQGPHLCDGCGEVLDGKRADARYCSGACRQRAYRQRGGDV